MVLGVFSTIIGQPLEDIGEEDEQIEEEEDADIGDEDEMADFIVDEEEVDEHGAPVRYVHRPFTCKCCSDFIVLSVNAHFNLCAGERKSRRADSGQGSLHRHSRKRMKFLVMLKIS